LPLGLIEIDKDEFDSLKNYKPPLTTNQKREQLILKIEQIEAKAYMRRGQRESWLAIVGLQMHSQGITHEQAYAANPEYKRVYDENVLATELRAEMKAL